MVCAFCICTYIINYLKCGVMKVLHKIILFFIILLFSSSINLSAQSGQNKIKQIKGINSNLKATANSNANAKIHANSNSVFSTANNNPNYNIKDQFKKDKIQVDRSKIIIKQKDKRSN